MLSISWSVICGTTGAIATKAGTPASVRARMAASRFLAAGALGSKVLWILGSSDVTEIATEAMPSFAAGAMMSRSRSTRSVIELLLETKHPFTITTKSDRVLRDLDIIAPAAKLGIASVAISVTSLDPKIHRTLEPRAPAARKRLAAIRALTDAGVPAFVAIAPVVPQITDHEIESIVAAAAEAGARGGFWLPVRLPHEVAPLFRAWLDEHYPDRASKVMATINSIRGGRDNDPNFFTRMRGQGPWAELLRTRFEKAAKRYGLPQAKFPLRRDLFEPPQGDQLRLL